MVALLLAMLPTYSTIAPELSVTCQHIAARLYLDEHAGRITHATASRAFEQCQLRYPPLAPDQPVDYL